MSDFDLVVTSGATLQPWADAGAASPRVNPRPSAPHLRWRGTVGTPIEVSARLADGTVAPDDVDLGGRTFVFWVAEYPLHVLGLSPGAESSVVTFVPVHAGHYLIGARRPQGGICLIHIDAAEP